MLDPEAPKYLFFNLLEKQKVTKMIFYLIVKQ